jgi:hypothetical protein
MSPIDLAWVAGLFEGEGCIVECRNRRKTVDDYVWFYLELRMTDEDVIRKLYRVTGCGYLGGPYTSNGASGKRKKPIWAWSVQRQDDVVSLIQELLPHMGERRAARMRYTLAAISNRRPAHVPAPRSCDEPDCPQKHEARGKCKRHYNQLRAAELGRWP